MSNPLTFLLGAAAGAVVMYYVGPSAGQTKSEAPFRRVVAFPEGTSYKTTLRATHSELAKVFGPPAQYPDGSETYNEWVFRGQDGKLFTIYDTADVGNAASKPNKLYTWHVGATGSAATFKTWVARKLREPRK